MAALVNRLKSGRESRAMAHGGFARSYQLHVFNIGNGDTVRVVVRACGTNGECHESDFLCRRNEVSRFLTDFLKGQAVHPDFVHQYVLRSSLNEQEWAGTCETAERDWEEPVAAREVDEVDDKRREALENKLLCERVGIRGTQREFVGNYLKMLTEFIVSEGWE